MMEYNHEVITSIFEQDISGKYAGGRALIILGGPSARGWEALRDEIRPDVLIGVNGVSASIPTLDYWLLMENMLRTNNEAQRGSRRAIELMSMVQRIGPRVRIVNKKTYRILENQEGALPVQRCGALEAEAIFSSGFCLRQYGNGLWKGALMRRPEIIGSLKLAVGTVGLQAIHFAGILGVSEVHTIGFDLCFTPGQDHHFYKYPVYESNHYWSKEKMFTKYKGVSTMFFWLDSAVYLQKVEAIFARDGLRWVDHSRGLLSMVGVRSAIS
jgi:hypothetical protein